MKWRGIRRNSLDVTNSSEEGLIAINSRFTVDGELRRRRGMARSSIQRKAASVTTINGFSAFQSNIMAALTDGDRIQGYQNVYALWGDNGVLQVPFAPIPVAAWTLDSVLTGLFGGGTMAISLGSVSYPAWYEGTALKGSPGPAVSRVDASITGGTPTEYWTATAEFRPAEFSSSVVRFGVNGVTMSCSSISPTMSSNFSGGSFAVVYGDYYRMTTVFTPSTVKTYLNGILRHTFTGSVNRSRPTTAQVELKDNSTVANLAIWDVAMSDDMVLSAYNDGIRYPLPWEYEP
jgi:hypothetical protein